MDEVKKFLDVLENDPRAKELSENLSIPYDEEKAIDVYIDMAKKLGFTITREDLLNWKQEEEEAYKAKAEKAEAGMMESLDMDQMDKVAGGNGHEKRCRFTYKSGEWCWFQDSCGWIICRY